MLSGLLFRTNTIVFSLFFFFLFFFHFFFFFNLKKNERMGFLVLSNSLFSRCDRSLCKLQKVKKLLCVLLTLTNKGSYSNFRINIFGSLFGICNQRIQGNGFNNNVLFFPPYFYIFFFFFHFCPLSTRYPSPIIPLGKGLVYSFFCEFNISSS